MNSVPNQRYLKFRCRREEKVPSRSRRGEASISLSSCRVVESSAAIDPLRGIHLSTTFGHGQLNRHHKTSEQEQVQKPSPTQASPDYSQPSDQRASCPGREK